jgi:hypothetical protein
VRPDVDLVERDALKGLGTGPADVLASARLDAGVTAEVATQVVLPGKESVRDCHCCLVCYKNG